MLQRLLAFAASILFLAPANADSWPGWRGMHGDGVSREATAPVQWEARLDGTSTGIVWKTPIPGKGHGSPIVVGDAIFLLTCIEETQQRQLLRIDRRTGKIVWRKTVLTAPLESVHPLNTRASSTPASDGEKVYVTFLDRDRMYAAAFDFEGNRVWERWPGPFASKHGFCTCPVVYRDWLILNGDHDGDAFLAAVRRADGETVWKTERIHRTRSYSTPVVLTIEGRDQVVLTGNFCTAGYDAETGRQLWTCDGPSEQMVATVVHRSDLIFSLGGFPEKHLLAIRKGGLGDVTRSHIAWRTNKAVPYVPSPLLYGDFLHVISDDGIYTCFDPPTGKVLTRQRAATHVSSSIIGAAGKVYITDDSGTTTVLENGPGMKVIAKNMLREDVRSTMAISDGRIYLRGVERLYCIGEPDGASPRTGR